MPLAIAVTTIGLTQTFRFAKQVGDETARAELVQLPGRTLEETQGTFVEILFRELKLAGQIGEEAALLVGALPRTVAVDRGGAPAGSGAIAVPIRVAVVAVATVVTVVAIAVRGGQRSVGFAISIAGHKARLLDLAVDGLLEQLVEPGDLAGDTVEVGEFGLNADRELV